VSGSQRRSGSAARPPQAARATQHSHGESAGVPSRDAAEGPPSEEPPAEEPSANHLADSDSTASRSSVPTSLSEALPTTASVVCTPRTRTPASPTAPSSPAAGRAAGGSGGLPRTHRGASENRASASAPSGLEEPNRGARGGKHTQPGAATSTSETHRWPSSTTTCSSAGYQPSGARSQPGGKRTSTQSAWFPGPPLPNVAIRGGSLPSGTELSGRTASAQSSRLGLERSITPGGAPSGIFG